MTEMDEMLIEIISTENNNLNNMKNILILIKIKENWKWFLCVSNMNEQIKSILRFFPCKINVDTLQLSASRNQQIHINYSNPRNFK